ncbi:hypothetical protein [Emticicia sp. 17c]|uniref:hypothetical protein n=1 Tax=Emticicia sp. 17c TaxID=3127704 RepID=UPI00301E278A
MDTNNIPERIIEHYNCYNIYIKENLFSDSQTQQKDVLYFLNKNGLNRKDIYELLRYINLYDSEINEDNESKIGNILDALSGFCNIDDAQNYIRFSDDPIKEDAFLKYMGEIAY